MKGLILKSRWLTFVRSIFRKIGSLSFLNNGRQYLERQFGVFIAYPVRKRHKKLLSLGRVFELDKSEELPQINIK